MWGKNPPHPQYYTLKGGELNPKRLKNIGIWKRQYPGFPDTIFDYKIKPAQGFEIGMVSIGNGNYSALQR
jgi:hypothetical protein